MTADKNQKNDYQEKIEKLAKDIKSDFDKDEKYKFCYIIGDNGTGKSSVLADIAVLYAEEEVKVKKDGDGKEKGEDVEYKKKADEEKNVFCIANTIYDRFFSIGSNKNITYLGARNVSNAIFYSSIDRQLIKALLKTKIKTIEDMVGFNFYLHIDDIDKDAPPIDKRKIKNRSYEDELLDAKHWKSVKEYVKYKDDNFLLIKLNTFDYLLDGGEVGNKELEVLKVLKVLKALKALKVLKLKELKEALRRLLNLNLSSTLKIGKDGKDGKEIISFDEMSSGEQIRISFFAKLMGNIENNCIFVIDEPEISFHLHWQQGFHALLKKAIEASGKTGVHAIIATHSPTLISEAARETDVLAFTLRKEESGNIVKTELKSTQSFERVVLNGFDTITHNSSTLEEQIIEIISSIDAKNESSKEEAENKLNELNNNIENDPIVEEIIKKARDIIEVIFRL